MATYQPIPVGDYKPMGVLAGIYAGENAANQEQQNRMANLAQLFDQRQKDLTYRTGQFKLDEDQYAAPNQRLASDVTGQLSREQLNTPGYFQDKVAGARGLDQVNVAAGNKATALSPSDIALGRATNATNTAGQEQKGYVTDIQNLMTRFQRDGKLATSSYITKNYTDPKQRDALLRELDGGVPGMTALLERLAASDPAQINKMSEQRLKNEGTLANAKVSAQGAVNAAKKAADAVILNGNKLMLAQAVAGADSALKLSKQYFEEVSASIEQFKGDRKSPAYQKLEKEQIAARGLANDAVREVIRLTKEAGNPQAGGGTVPAPTGGEGGVINVTLADLKNGPTATPAASSAPVAQPASPAVSVAGQSNPAYLRQQQEREQQAARRSQQPPPVDQGEARAKYQQWLRSIGHIKD